MRFGREHLDDKWSDTRAVVQFAVGTSVFDWFFNARTGYRAHFRAHYKCGLRFNNQIVEAIGSVLDTRLPETVRVRELGRGFTDCGEALIPKAVLLSSLVPYLAKIWCCTKRIKSGGGIEDLPPGVVGEPRLLLGGESWVALWRDEDGAWLDVKGGFLGGTRPYQPKKPFERARTLQALGTA